MRGKGGSITIGGIPVGTLGEWRLTIANGGTIRAEKCTIKKYWATRSLGKQAEIRPVLPSNPKAGLVMAGTIVEITETTLVINRLEDRTPPWDGTGATM